MFFTDFEHPGAEIGVGRGRGRGGYYDAFASQLLQHHNNYSRYIAHMA